MVCVFCLFVKGECQEIILQSPEKWEDSACGAKPEPLKAKAVKASGFAPAQGFWKELSKPWRLPRERRGAPVEICMAAMAEARKSGAKEPFLRNCAGAAGRKRKAFFPQALL